jgi:serine/threonine protein kinase
MQLLTAFKHGESPFFLLPLADCSLKEIFQQENPKRDPFFVIWILNQLSGLAEGLHAIHGDTATDLVSSSLSLQQTQNTKVIGYHHDLTPANILLRKDKENADTPFNEMEEQFGRFQLSDFGLARFREPDTGSKSLNIKGTQTYAAPESRLRNVGQSRSYDIWSFGCIILETMVWLMRGPSGREEFRDRRYEKDPELVRVV